MRYGSPADIDEIKAIAASERHALGFVHRQSLLRAIARDELLVASLHGRLVGFCQLYRRADGVLTIYHIAVARPHQGEGIGRQFLERLGVDAMDNHISVIRLKCPVDLPANGFYDRSGFTKVRVEGGVVRSLNVWEQRIGAEPPHPTVPPSATGEGERADAGGIAIDR